MATLVLWLGMLLLAGGAVMYLVTGAVSIGGRGRPQSESTGRRMAVLCIVLGLLLASGGCMAGGGQA